MHSLLDLKLAGAINDERRADAAAQGKRAARTARRGRTGPSRTTAPASKQG